MSNTTHPSENLKTALIKSDKKATTLGTEKGDLEAAHEKSERMRKALDIEKADLLSQIATLEQQRTSVESSRKKLDAECHGLRDTMEDIEGRLKHSCCSLILVVVCTPVVVCF